MGLQKHYLFSDFSNQLAQLFQVLSAGARITILQLLLEKGQATNKELVNYTGLCQSSISGHLQILTSFNLLKATLINNYVLYEINREKWETLKSLAFAFANPDLEL